MQVIDRFIAALQWFFVFVCVVSGAVGFGHYVLDRMLHAAFEPLEHMEQTSQHIIASSDREWDCRPPTKAVPLPPFQSLPTFAQGHRQADYCLELHPRLP